MICRKELQATPILQGIQNCPQSQSQVTQSIPMGYPQVKKLPLLQAPEPTPQRRRVNCFQQITSTSWWPHSGPRSIRRSRKPFLITKQVRKPVSRLTRKTMRRHRILKQTTKAMVKEDYFFLEFILSFINLTLRCYLTKSSIDPLEIVRLSLDFFVPLLRCRDFMIMLFLFCVSAMFIFTTPYFSY